MSPRCKITPQRSLAPLALAMLATLALGAPQAHAQTCGDGVVEGIEQCDDGGMSGGCCTAACRFAPADAVCNDGNPNTTDACSATGVCVGRAETTSCGTCRDPNDPLDRSYCDPATNQCVRQVEECPPFLIEADGSENRCVSNYGRDPANGQCLYRQKVCRPPGCIAYTCDPADGECKLDPNDPSYSSCGGDENFCQPTPNCLQEACFFESCSAFGAPFNCASKHNLDCHRLNPSSCQVAPPNNDDLNIINGCRSGFGCDYQGVACSPPANPCDVLVRDANAEGCCTYQPRDCAAEYGHDPLYTYHCDPTAPGGVCIATPVPPPDSDGDGVPDPDDAFPFDSNEWADTDGDGTGNNADLDDDDDLQADADEAACGSNPLDATSTSPDRDGDHRPDCVDVADADVTIALDLKNPPVGIPWWGGLFRFSYALRNTTSQKQTVQTWIVLALPDGQREIKVGPVKVTLKARQSQSWTVLVLVPFFVPEGTYTMTGYVGRYPNGAIDQDGFTFVKQPRGAGKQEGEPVADWSVVDEATGAPLADVGEAETAVPAEYVLEAAFPNPFNPRTTIRYALQEASEVRLAVYDVAGREVARLVDGPVAAGRHEAVFEAGTLPSGVYLVRLEAGGHAFTQHLTLLK